MNILSGVWGSGWRPLSEIKNNPALTETLPTELASLLQLTELYAASRSRRAVLLSCFVHAFTLRPSLASPLCETRLTNGWRVARWQQQHQRREPERNHSTGVYWPHSAAAPRGGAPSAAAAPERPRE